MPWPPCPVAAQLRSGGCHRWAPHPGGCRAARRQPDLPQKHSEFGRTVTVQGHPASWAAFISDNSVRDTRRLAWARPAGLGPGVEVLRLLEPRQTRSAGLCKAHEGRSPSSLGAHSLSWQLQEVPINPIALGWRGRPSPPQWPLRLAGLKS